MLKKFMDEQSEKTEVKPDQYKDIVVERCYITFAYNNQTGELEPRPWTITIYASNQDKTITVGGDVMAITGEPEMDSYIKDIKDGCDPKEDITSIASTEMVDLVVYEIIPELANIFYNECTKAFECGEGGAAAVSAGPTDGATPANTIGAGNPEMPSGDKPGSGDSFTYNPRRPASKKEKKDKSKTKKLS